MIQSTTGISDQNNEIKWAVMKTWQEGDISSAADDTYPRLTGMSFQTKPVSPTQLMNPFLLTKVAEGWQSMKPLLWENPYNPQPISAFDPTFIEKCSLSFNEEVNRFCSQHNIEAECAKYYEIFIDVFKNIQGITIDVSPDYELVDYSKINFLLTLSDEVENVLRYEDAFKIRIRKEIDKEKRCYFTYNYNLI